MFNRNTKSTIEALEKEIEQLKINETIKDKDIELKNLIKTIADIEEDHKKEKDFEVKEKTQVLTIENNKLTAKVEILEKAFENMGFDVKDMKEILNKLVDGLIAKNAINILKS